MQKGKSVLYWIVTALLALAMLSGGIAQIIQADQNKEGMLRLGYPLYFMPFIGICKILGVIAILAPGNRLVKEWAYAGFFFVLSGAGISHIAAGDSFQETIAPLAFIIFTVMSWYLRPVRRKLITN